MSSVIEWYLDQHPEKQHASEILIDKLNELIIDMEKDDFLLYPCDIDEYTENGTDFKTVGDQVYARNKLNPEWVCVGPRV